MSEASVEEVVRRMRDGDVAAAESLSGRHLPKLGGRLPRPTGP